MQVLAKVDELVELMGLGAFKREADRRAVDRLAGASSTWPASSPRTRRCSCSTSRRGGVAQKETEALGPLLLRVREHAGCSVLVIEHDMPLLSPICDRMVALELGGIIAEGPPAEVLEHPR